MLLKVVLSIGRPTWSQNACASAYGADIDVVEEEEAIAAANDTSTATNKTISENMTGANSTR